MHVRKNQINAHKLFLTRVTLPFIGIPEIQGELVH